MADLTSFWKYVALGMVSSGEEIKFPNNGTDLHSDYIGFNIGQKLRLNNITKFNRITWKQLESYAYKFKDVEGITWHQFEFLS